MRIISYITAAMLFAAPAFAINITNLDDTPHAIVQEWPGNVKRTHLLEPNETLKSLQANGFVYLQKHPNHRISIHQYDRLVIWPSGKLQIQKRRDLSGN